MKIESANLQRAMNRVAKLAGGRTTLPILNMAHLSAIGGVLVVTTSDLTAWAVARVACDGDLPPTCASAQKLKLLADASRDSIELTVTKEGLKFAATGLDCTLSTIPADEYPAYPTDKLESIAVNCADLAEGIRRTAWACSEEESRYTLQSCWITLTAKSLLVVASNGKAVGRFEMPAIATLAAGNIHKNYAGELADMLDEDGALLKMSANFIGAESDFGTMLVKQVEGNRPGFEQVGAQKYIDIGDLDREQTADALSLSRGMAMSEKSLFVPVIVKFEPDGAYFDSEKFRRVVPGTFKDGVCKLDANLAAKLFASMSGDTIKVSLWDMGNGFGMRVSDGNTAAIIAGMSI